MDSLGYFALCIEPNDLKAINQSLLTDHPDLEMTAIFMSLPLELVTSNIFFWYLQIFLPVRLVVARLIIQRK